MHRLGTAVMSSGLLALLASGDFDARRGILEPPCGFGGASSGRVIAIVVGLDAPDGRAMTRGAENDARGFVERMRQEERLNKLIAAAQGDSAKRAVYRGSIAGEESIPSCRVETVLVDSVIGASVTREGLAAAFRRASQAARPNDAFVFFFAGSGFPVARAKSPTDRVQPCDLERERCTVLFKMRGGAGRPGEASATDTTLSLEALSQWIATVPASRQLLVLDACAYNGLGVDLVQLLTNPLPKHRFNITLK